MVGRRRGETEEDALKEAEKELVKGRSDEEARGDVKAALPARQDGSPTEAGSTGEFFRTSCATWTDARAECQASRTIAAGS